MSVKASFIATNGNKIQSIDPLRGNVHKIEIKSSTPLRVKYSSTRAKRIQVRTTNLSTL